LVEAIEDGVLHVRGEGPRIVLEAGGVNFDLKSESEQRGFCSMSWPSSFSYLPGRYRSWFGAGCMSQTSTSRRSALAAIVGGKRRLREKRLAEYRAKVRSLVQGKRSRTGAFT